MINLVNFEMIESNFDARYEGSKFESYKKLGAKQKGAVSERILTDVLTQMDFDVQMPINSDHDRIIDGVKVEMKCSTLNKGTEKFSFLQIRPNQDNEQYMFGLFFPNNLRVFTLDKATIKELIGTNEIKPQHGGNNGNSGTFCWYPTIDRLEQVAQEIN